MAERWNGRDVDVLAANLESLALQGKRLQVAQDLAALAAHARALAALLNWDEVRCG
jgi:ABC-type phosphate transport system auxiliary subunit